MKNQQARYFLLLALTFLMTVQILQACDANCALCDQGPCTQCSGGYDLTTNCTTCTSRYDIGTNCTTCLPEYNGTNCSNCDTGYYSNGSNC